MGSKPRLLDLFCGAGGAAMGYHRAGFDVVGVDVKPQPRYPFEFHQGDALMFPLDGFDAIHASPPCQFYSTMRVMPNARKHPDLVALTRDRLRASGLPYVIENVPGAPLVNPTILCGSMFGLESDGMQLRRHRLFEMHPDRLLLVPPCSHKARTVGVFGSKARDIALEKRHYGQDKATRGKPVGVLLEQRVGFEAMGIDWMTIEEASLAIPPAYTEFIGRALMAAITKEATPNG